MTCWCTLWTGKRFHILKSEYVQKKKEDEKFQQVVDANCELEEYIYLLDAMNSVYDKCITNKRNCNVLQKVIATIHS